jgi:cell division protein FtsB
MDVSKTILSLLQKHARSLLALFVIVLFVHNVFGAHGFLAMRRTRQDIERVKKDIDRLNAENTQLEDEVKALKTDPHMIEKIARDDLGLARPGEVIIKIPQPPQPERASPSRP